MEYTYLSLHISSLEEVVKYGLYNRFSDIKIIDSAEGLTTFNTNAPLEKVSSIPFVSNTFVIIEKYQGITVAEFIKKASHTDLTKISLPIVNKRTFRVVFFNEGQMSRLPDKESQKIEEIIESNTVLKINPINPDTEFWLIYRSDKTAYFAVRISQPLPSENQRKRGELRSDLATLLCLLSEPTKSDVFLDPFAGYGSIPRARMNLVKYSKIYASDKIKLFDLSNVNFIQADISHGIPLEDESIDKIVTDPPWGEFDKSIENLEELFDKSFSEFYRLLKNDGILVILLNREFNFITLLQKYSFKIEKTYNILVSGKKATAFRFKKS